MASARVDLAVYDLRGRDAGAVSGPVNASRMAAARSSRVARVGRVEGVDSQVVEVSVAVQPVPARVADLCLDGPGFGGVRLSRRV